ncbi:lysophospholipid acyltransferase family protein [Aestuariivivens marinum]|uniref:lysophospholipid acyltransferase family protein n=1 Tax=Aestuariivivens marinum TaxID=2913555 RepID=UPI001F5ADEE1|nr:lysophospholipid acyltransferase family protein [Aestuariivivens marinum]
MGSVLGKLWLHTIRAYLRIGLFFYFKEIRIVKYSNVPKYKPVLFLANHQNALIDALLIATRSGRFSYFLTRAAVFKKPLVSKLLHTFRMLPVYRIRDGWNTLTQNNSIFNTCSLLLQQGKAVAIFPEGSHNIIRTVRPLSKGFTRIVFETLEKYPDTDLQLIPIGLNFEKADTFPDSVTVIFGKAIAAKDFLLDDKNEAVNQLKTRVHTEISKLTTHIPSKDYNATLSRLESLGADFLNPVAVNDCMASNFSNCQFKKELPPRFLSMVFKVFFVALLFAPYGIWKFAVEPKIDEVEFVSTFRFALAITLVPLWLLIVYIALFLAFNWGVATGFLAISLIIILVRVKA